MISISIWIHESDMPIEIQQAEWDRDDFDYVVATSSLNYREIDIADHIAEKITTCDVTRYDCVEGRVFFVTYHA